MAIYELEGKVPQVADTAFVHPLAAVVGDVLIEDGCFIAPGASLRGDFGSIRVGVGSNIQDNCILHADPDKPLTLGPNSHIGHGAILHSCTLKEHVTVGMGAIVLEDVIIGEECIIGAGAVVTGHQEILPRKLLLGVPAKIVGDVTPQQIERTWLGTRRYQTLPPLYKRSLKRIDM